jgi:hypothetical protein
MYAFATPSPRRKMPPKRQRSTNGAGGGVVVVAQSSRGKHARMRLSIPKSLASRAKASRVVVQTTGFLLQLNSGATALNWGVQFYPLGSMAVVAGGSGSNSFQFWTSLSQIYLQCGGGGVNTAAFPNVADITSAYDQYRVLRVELEMVYQNNSTTVGSLGALPAVYLCTNTTDSTPLTLAQIQQEAPTLINFGDSRKKRWSLTPAAQQVVAYGTATATSIGAISKPKQWFDTASSTVDLYGVKGVYDNPYGGNALDYGFITFYVKQYVEVRDQR